MNTNRSIITSTVLRSKPILD